MKAILAIELLRKNNQNVVLYHKKVNIFHHTVPTSIANNKVFYNGLEKVYVISQNFHLQATYQFANQIAMLCDGKDHCKYTINVAKPVCGNQACHLNVKTFRLFSHIRTTYITYIVCLRILLLSLILFCCTLGSIFAVPDKATIAGGETHS